MIVRSVFMISNRKTSNQASQILKAILWNSRNMQVQHVL